MKATMATNGNLATCVANHHLGQQPDCPNSHQKERVLIMGAAGRDYHLFNEKYRSNSSSQVVCFTHAQVSLRPVSLNY